MWLVFGVGGGVSHGHTGLDDANVDGILALDRGIFDPVSFELTDKATVQDGLILVIGDIYGAGEAIQDVRHCNLPPHA